MEEERKRIWEQDRSSLQATIDQLGQELNHQRELHVTEIHALKNELDTALLSADNFSTQCDQEKAQTEKLHRQLEQLQFEESTLKTEVVFYNQPVFQMTVL
jgi:chromosome segregation ATPase